MFIPYGPQFKMSVAGLDPALLLTPNKLLPLSGGDPSLAMVATGGSLSRTIFGSARVFLDTRASICVLACVLCTVVAVKIAVCATPRQVRRGQERGDRDGRI
jgi:hypothetical protein